MSISVTEDYVSFENAKLLKEKGFISEESKLAFDKRGFSFIKDEYNPSGSKFIGSTERPTQALAIKWLRVVHGISISVNREGVHKEVYDKYIVRLTWPTFGQTQGYSFLYFDTPEEATEAAILYVLKHVL